MQFPIRNPDRYARLERLSADEAIACYLRGDFTIGEETALTTAIQRGLSLPMKSEQIQDIIFECMDEGLSAEACRARLIEGA